eukprot:TRINITY_DN5796_c0_g1_i1.p1 TRINITY_DN5796_c0_g1~~TRINITY_DN5796_c0_g1_i1.p1  ORF type:complete len:293 (-),score=67.99 TRINITY_DN5796_c0_g1_i1:26-904(-)
MKFLHTLERNMVSEWTDYYVGYSELKGQIKKIQERSLRLAQAFSDIQEITNEIVMHSEIDLMKLQVNTEFWDMIDKYINTVETFYEDQEHLMLDQFHFLAKKAVKMGLVSKFNPIQNRSSRLEREISRLPTKHSVTLKHDDESNSPILSREAFPLHKIETVEEFVNSKDTDDEIELDVIDTNHVKKHHRYDVKSKLMLAVSKEELRQSFREYYRGLILLDGYCKLNYEAFGKILKKYDKTFGTKRREKMLQIIQEKTFFAHANLKVLVQQTELFFATVFTAVSYTHLTLPTT